MLDFLQGMMLGFGAAIPLGPINILIMNEALKSFKNGAAIGWGAMSADALYLTLITLGINKYFNFPWLLNILSILGAVFLLYIAYSIFINRNNLIKKIQIDTKNSVLKHYLKGFFLTLLNPYTIAFWLSVATLSINVSSKFLIIGGLLFAILIWVSAMPYFISKTKHLISTKLYSVISTICAGILVFFALAMLAKTFLN